MLKQTYTLKLSSSSNYISLPYKITDARSLKVTQARFTTASTNNLFMMIQLTGWTDKFYTDASRIMRYTKILLLPDTITSQVMYDNTSQLPDIIKPNSMSDFNSFTIDLLIGKTDGTIEYTTDITSTNPVYLELEFEISE